tara:strand:+ start:362 stop:1096 length:735 start_codon:yes stop_codon:yes gene_type:complete
MIQVKARGLYRATLIATTLLGLLIAGSLRASEEDLYDFLWLDPDKSVYVLQNKVYKKKNSFYGSVGYLQGQSSKFQDTSGVKLEAGYFFHEEFAIDLFWSSYSNSDNDAYKSLATINQSVPFVRRPLSNYAVGVVYAPFYGKINTFNKIFYFDWSFGLGLGKFETESNAKSVSNPGQANTFNKESYTTIVTKTKLRFHATKNFHIDLELLRNNYNAPGADIPNRATEKSWRNNTDIIIGVGFSF